MTNEKVTKDAPKKKRQLRVEYKAAVVRLCEQAGKTAYSVARDLGLTPSVVTAWVRQARGARAEGGTGALTTTEREELASLRREGRTLR